MGKIKLSSFLFLCSLLIFLGFIIKIAVHGLLQTLDTEIFLFGILEFIIPAVILLTAGLYIRRRSKNTEEKR